MEIYQTIQGFFFPDSIEITPEINESEVSQLETESLIAHNWYRALHNAPPLKISEALTAKAKMRAMVIYFN